MNESATERNLFIHGNPAGAVYGGVESWKNIAIRVCL